MLKKTLNGMSCVIAAGGTFGWGFVGFGKHRVMQVNSKVKTVTIIIPFKEGVVRRARSAFSSLTCPNICRAISVIQLQRLRRAVARSKAVTFSTTRKLMEPLPCDIVIREHATGNRQIRWRNLTCCPTSLFYSGQQQPIGHSRGFGGRPHDISAFAICFALFPFKTAASANDLFHLWIYKALGIDASTLACLSSAGYQSFQRGECRWRCAGTGNFRKQSARILLKVECISS